MPVPCVLRSLLWFFHLFLLFPLSVSTFCLLLDVIVKKRSLKIEVVSSVSRYMLLADEVRIWMILTLSSKKILNIEQWRGLKFSMLCKASGTMEHSYMMKASGFYHKRSNKSLNLDQIISSLFCLFKCHLQIKLDHRGFFVLSLSAFSKLFVMLF